MPVIENILTHSIATDFTRTPGPRFIVQGPSSGEQFRNEFLEPWFLEARQNGLRLRVDLDGGYGYAPSFLEEAFGGLARIYAISDVLSTIEIKTEEEPMLGERIQKYIQEARKK